MSMHVHPVFAAILANIAPPPIDKRLADYKAALARFDWDYNFSDDGRVVAARNERLNELRREARAIDPDHMVWNAIAPEKARDGRVFLS